MRTAQIGALLMGIGFLTACYDSTPTSPDDLRDEVDVPLEVARSGSPITNYVLLDQWGTAGSEPGEFNQPNGIGLDSEGNVYVLDRYNYRVQKFDADGGFITQWGAPGQGDGQFSSSVRGLAVDEDDYVYTIEAHRVQKFDADGTFRLTWGRFGYTKIRDFAAPFNVAAAGGFVYVVDGHPDVRRVKKFTNGGASVMQWSTDVSWPAGLAATDSYVYVTGPHGGQFRRYDTEGQNRLVISGQGAGPGQFLTPGDLAVDADGYVYALDTRWPTRVQKFDFDGTFIVQFGYGAFGGPSSVAVDPSGRAVYVTDGQRDIVYKFGPSNSPPDLTSIDGPANPVGLGTEVTIVGHFTDPDAGDTHDAWIDWGDDDPATEATVDEVAGTATGAYTYDDPGVYTVTVTVTDAYNESDSEVFEFVVIYAPPELISLTGPAAPVLLGTGISVVGTFTDADDGDSHDATVDWGDDNPATTATIDEVAGTATGGYTYDEPGVYTVTMTVTDSFGGSDSEVFEFVVVYVPPDLASLTGPIEPMLLGTEVSVLGTFTDADEDDPHEAWIDWGDGNPAAAATIDELAGTATGAYTYDEPGVYRVTMTLTDSFGASDTEVFEYVVIYDPAGGFVTGGGWIDSPAGAFEADPDLTGKANFGFVAKYKKGASVPTGNTQFQFKAGDLNFHSSSYDWLVVNQGGTRAQFKGEGTINGTGVFKFMLWADDDDPDTFRIRITDLDDGKLYDNGVKQTLGGGSIKIHTKK